jgi:hypothetical protein
MTCEHHWRISEVEPVQDKPLLEVTVDCRCGVEHTVQMTKEFLQRQFGRTP